MEREERPTATDVSRVWGAPLAAVHCAHCGEAHLVPQDAVPSRCPFCLQAPVAPQPAYLREEPPEQALPCTVSEQQLAGVLEQWSKGIWFRPSDLQPGELKKRARRYLIPLWLVDGRMSANWRADVGFDYQVVSYQDRYREGAGWSSQEMQETRVRWEPRVGRLDRAYENVAAPALDDHRALMARLGDYDLAQRTGYSPEAAAGAAVRIPSLEPEAAWPGAEAAFVHIAQAECRQAAGADHVRDFTLEAEYGAGLLREPVSSLNRAGAVVITRCDQITGNDLSELEKKLQAINSGMIIARSIHAAVSVKYPEPSVILAQAGIQKDAETMDPCLRRNDNIEQLKGKKVFAFCGIGNPDAFLNTIKNLGAELAGSKVYDDHYHYTDACLTEISEQAEKLGADLILTTQKDWTKVISNSEFPISESKSHPPFAYLAVEIKFLAGEDKLTALIKETLAGKIPQK